MIETVRVQFTRATDTDGQKTCQTKAFNCRFFGLRKFGQVETCTYTQDDLNRRNDGAGSLIPADACPMWR